MAQKHHVFVLSGGSVMGAFQVGELVALTEKLDPSDLVAGIFGVSVGSLNTAFVANAMASAGATSPTIKDLRDAAIKLEKFWIQNVSGPQSLVGKASLLSIVRGIGEKNWFFNGWHGAVTHKPLTVLFQKALSDYLAVTKLQIPITVGYTNYCTGDYYSQDIRSTQNIAQMQNFVSRSMVTPLIMDVEEDTSGGVLDLFSDGGLRHVVPSIEVVELVNQMLGSGIDSSQVHVHQLICVAKEMGGWIDSQGTVAATGKRPSMVDFIQRAFDMMTDAVVTADLRYIADGLKPLNVGGSVYQSKQEYFTKSITSFTSADITSMIDYGKSVVEQYYPKGTAA